MKSVNLKNNLLATLSIHLWVIALAVGLVTVVSCGGNRSDSQQPAGEQQEMQAIEAQEQQTAPQKEPTDWLRGDFKLSYEEKPMTLTAGLMGKQDNTTTRYTWIRVKDKLYVHSVVVGAGESHVLFSMENGTLMCYTFNPQKKIAAKGKANFETIDGALIWNLEASVYASPKGMEKMTKTGTENIAGINCDVYKNEAELTNEQLDKETKGLEALAGLLGGDTKQMEETKKQFGGMSGTTTYWIDPAKKRFIARKHIYLNMNGKITDVVTHFVTFFQDSNIDASEIPDISEYAIQN